MNGSQERASANQPAVAVAQALPTVFVPAHDGLAHFFNRDRLSSADACGRVKVAVCRHYFFLGQPGFGLAFSTSQVSVSSMMYTANSMTSRESMF